jgi:type VI secretion system secreted protein Hcp
MAAVDMFLMIDGIKGESADDKHKGEIEIESFSWGASNSGSFSSGGGGGSGKANFQDIHFTARLGKDAPNLLMACALGTHIKYANLVMRKAGGKQEEFLKYKFEDLMVSSVQFSGSAHADVPSSQISLNCAKWTMECAEQKKDGSLDAYVKAAYDIKAQKKV